MSNACCTIITSDYIHYALALNESLVRYQSDVPLYIFVTDRKVSVEQWKEKVPNVHFLYIEDLCKNGLGKAIYEAYANSYMDAFRWSMKGVLMTHLIEQMGHQKVIYVDCDIYFFNDYQFLWKELDQHRFLITPHWRAAPRFKENPGELSSLFTEGLYNAGFIGVNHTALPILEKLAEWCLHECVKAPEKGVYVDQTYLNLLPIYYDGVKIIKHKGCNVAGWNLIECKREKVGEQVLIEGQFEIIFIHFVRYGVWFVLNGMDEHLQTHLDTFLTALKRYKPDFDYYQHYKLFELDGSLHQATPQNNLSKRIQVVKQKSRISYKTRDKIREKILAIEGKIGISLPQSVKDKLKKLIS